MAALFVLFVALLGLAAALAILNNREMPAHSRRRDTRMWPSSRRPR
jgi:hypothetical protein